MKWEIKETNFFKVSLYKKVFKELKLSSIMAKVLINRDINMEIAFKLLNKPEELLEDSRKIYGAESAANEILNHLKQKKVFHVYADYDIDGLTSGYIITEYLRSLGEKVEVKFPQRSEGYGINAKFCEEIVKKISTKKLCRDNCR